MRCSTQKSIDHPIQKRRTNKERSGKNVTSTLEKKAVFPRWRKGRAEIKEGSPQNGKILPGGESGRGEMRDQEGT